MTVSFKAPIRTLAVRRTSAFDSASLPDQAYKLTAIVVASKVDATVQKPFFTSRISLECCRETYRAYVIPE